METNNNNFVDMDDDNKDQRSDEPGQTFLKLKEQPVKSKSKTLAQTLVGSHEHIIKGYSLLKGIGDGEPIASEKFVVGGHEWVLLFYPDGKKSQSDQHIAHHPAQPNRAAGGQVNQVQIQAAVPNADAALAPAQPNQNQMPAENNVQQVLNNNLENNVVGNANEWPIMAPPQTVQYPLQALLQHGTPQANNPQFARPGRRDQVSNDYCALFVALIGEGPNPLGVVNTNDGKVVRAFHRFTLVDQTGASKGLEKGRKREDGAVKISCSRADPNARNCHGYRKFVKKQNLEDPSKGYLLNDTIIIRYTIELVVTQGGVFQKTPPGRGEGPRRSLADDFTSLYSSMENADLSVVVEGTTFQAHRLVLQTRSKVFAVMLSSDMREGKSDLITVEDMKKDIFEGMLHYMYCDMLPANMDHEHFTFPLAQHLMVAADRYELHGLRTLCEARLGDTIHLDTVMQTLDLAFATHADDLKQRCLDFVAYNLEYLIHTDGYQKVLQDNKTLLNELNASIAKLGYASSTASKVYHAFMSRHTLRHTREGGVKEEGNDDALNPRKRQRIGREQGM